MIKKLMSIMALSLPSALALGATINVNTTDDSLSFDGRCSLREAIRAANLDQTVNDCPAGAGADEIVVPAGIYRMELAGVRENEGRTGDYDITADLTIRGAGAGSTIIDAFQLDRVFHIINRDISVTLERMTVRGGVSRDRSGGAGIYNNGNLTLSGVLLTDNEAANESGGALYNYFGSIDIENSTISNNEARDGGGIYVYRPSAVEITGSAIRSNTATRYVGGIYLDGSNIFPLLEDVIIADNVAAQSVGGIEFYRGTHRVLGSTIANNVSNGTGSSGGGGGVYVSSSTTVRFQNSTLSGNRAPQGGGVFAYSNSAVTITDSTIADNAATEKGGGIQVEDSSATLELARSIVAGNSAPNFADTGGIITLDGYNLIQAAPEEVQGDQTGLILGQDPALAPLGNYGGFAPTHALLSSSPAIDASNNAECPAEDQRGVSRPLDGDSNGSAVCDIGAYEWNGSVIEQLSRLSNDFNGDGLNDLLWRNRNDGRNIVWLMSGANRKGAALIPTINDPNWQAAGVADFDGDGKTDILWRNQVDGRNLMWFMSGGRRVGAGLIPPVVALDWQVAGVNDFNGDQKADILWRTGSGNNIIWLMDGLERIGFNLIQAMPADWEAMSTADFNGDQQGDVLWRNAATGRNILWLIRNAARSNAVLLPSVVDNRWELAAAGDVSGDGKADILWRNTSDGRNLLWLMDGGTRTAQGLLPTVASQAWQVADLTDFDGDGMADIHWRLDDGRNIVWFLNGLTRRLAQLSFNIPAAWDPIR